MFLVTNHATGQTTNWYKDTNDKNDSKDNPKDDSNTKSNCIWDDTPFLFFVDFILANSRRNNKRQNQNSSCFHFAWWTLFVFSSSLALVNDFQIMEIFNAYWFDGKNSSFQNFAKKNSIYIFSSIQYVCFLSKVLSQTY